MARVDTESHTDAPKTIYLKDYQVPDYLIDKIDLNFDIHEGYTLVTAKSWMRHNPNSENHEAPLTLNGEHLELVSISLNGHVLDEDGYSLNSQTLSLPAPQTESFELEIVTRIKPEENTALEGLYCSNNTYCTQCEAEGFRRITYYLDRPDVMARFTTRIEADHGKCPVLLSNGNLIEEGKAGQGRHYTIWEDPFPKPCYLFALVAGDLVYIQDDFATMSGKNVDLRIYVRDGDQEQCWHAMESLKASMTWDEEKYGREYDLERFNIVAVSDFTMGAMENNSLNIFNTSCILAHQDTATDNDFMQVEAVVAHEYFHNWTGNRITCRDWFQLSLKEGLTVFRDQSFSADMHSEAVQRISDVEVLRRAQFPEDSSPMAHPIRPDNYIEINNFYTATVYEKGSEVIRMLHTILGNETYRKATDLYFDRHDGQAVTCEDFVQCMRDASGMDLDQFELWYSQAGTPKITINGTYSGADKSYTLTLEQDSKKPMHIPVAVGLLDSDGNDMQLDVASDDNRAGDTTRLLHLTQPKQSFTFKNVTSKPVPSILRNFSAPVKLETDLSEADLRFLMVHDSDGFNRWEAGQQLALRLLQKMVDAEESGKPVHIDPAFTDAFGATLDQADDKALLAKSMSLPSEGYIAQHRKTIDPRAIHTARDQLKKALADLHFDALLQLYRDNQDGGTYRKSTEAIAQRSLKNAALGYLMTADRPEVISLAKTQYDEATNMTDRVAAIANLAETESDEREDALQDFYKRFEDYPLVIDKWFALQAMAARKNTIDDVRALLKHKDFTYKNPNRLRSLIGVFCSANPVCFHAADGSGYELLADTVITLNDINPQIAARLLGPIRQWKLYTPDRQDIMKSELQRIADNDSLSPDVYEIVSKTLQG